MLMKMLPDNGLISMPLWDQQVPPLTGGFIVELSITKKEDEHEFVSNYMLQTKKEIMHGYQ